MNTDYKSITSWKDIAKALGLDMSLKGDLSNLPAFMRPFVANAANLAAIVAAINGVDFIPDWDNRNQRKWWGWFWMDKPGFRLLDSAYGVTGTYSSGGSRLCFETEEQFLHATKYFLHYFEAFYGGKILKIEPVKVAA